MAKSQVKNSFGRRASSSEPCIRNTSACRDEFAASLFPNLQSKAISGVLGLCPQRRFWQIGKNCDVYLTLASATSDNHGAIWHDLLDVRAINSLI
jgi:hypothetical protein